MKTALTIAGSDSCGGAGIQSDLKTFAACGVYGLSAITAVTAQNTCRVAAVKLMDAAILQAQLEAIYTDIPVDAVKIGMLGDLELTTAVVAAIGRYAIKNIVLDPMLLASSGRSLLEPAAVEVMKRELFPRVLIVTPNLPEAEVLAGIDVRTSADILEAAKRIHAMGVKYVIVKGGHLAGAAGDLLYDGQTSEVFSQERIDNIHTHGTGCTFSSAIAAGLAKGFTVRAAVSEAKAHITMAIQHGFKLGRGAGPTHHFYALYKDAGKC